MGTGDGIPPFRVRSVSASATTPVLQCAYAALLRCSFPNCRFSQSRCRRSAAACDIWRVASLSELDRKRGARDLEKLNGPREASSAAASGGLNLNSLDVVPNRRTQEMPKELKSEAFETARAAGDLRGNGDKAGRWKSGSCSCQCTPRVVGCAEETDRELLGQLPSKNEEKHGTPHGRVSSLVIERLGIFLTVRCERRHPLSSPRRWHIANTGELDMTTSPASLVSLPYSVALLRTAARTNSTQTVLTLCRSTHTTGEHPGAQQATARAASNRAGRPSTTLPWKRRKTKKTRERVTRLVSPGGNNMPTVKWFTV